MPVGNVILLSGLPSMRADVVSAPDAGFGHCGPDGRPLGGRPALATGPVRDVALLQTLRARTPYYRDTTHLFEAFPSAGTGLGGLGMGIPMPTKWWHWVGVAAVGYLAAKQLKLL